MPSFTKNITKKNKKTYQRVRKAQYKANKQQTILIGKKLIESNAGKEKTEASIYDDQYEKSQSIRHNK